MEETFDSMGGIIKNGDCVAGNARKEQSGIKLIPPHSEPPKGLCFKYWKTGSCAGKRRCKFLHVRDPEVRTVMPWTVVFVCLFVCLSVRPSFELPSWGS